MTPAIVCIALVAGFVAQAQSLTTGRWDGIVSIDGQKVPFSMQVEGTEDPVKGSFFHGEERVASTGGTFKGGVLRLTFGQFATVLEAKLVDGALKGAYGGARFGNHALEASPYCTCSYEGEAGPDVTGTWEMLEGREKTPLSVRRKGEDTFATMNGATHTGRFDGLQFTLNHFDGARASTLEIVPGKDGTLAVSWKAPRSAAKNYRAVKKTGNGTGN